MRSLEDRNKLFEENKNLVYGCMSGFDIKEGDREDMFHVKHITHTTHETHAHKLMKHITHKLMK